MNLISRIARLAMAPAVGFVKASWTASNLPRVTSLKDMVRQDVTIYFAPFRGAVNAFRAELKRR